jgi:YrhK-like protein
LTSARPLIRAPEEWVLEERGTVGPFVTRERYRLPDGSVRTWSSRRHRKVGREEERAEGLAHPWWRPERIGWWVATAFMVGSLAFALGPFPPYADAVASPSTVATTYFVGSLFFTTAGYLQFVQTINAEPERRGRGKRIRLIAWQPHRIAWWAASVQSVGTLLFNRSTFHALDAALSTAQQNRLVWAPDLFGSVAFIVASTLAWLEVCHRWWGWRPRDTGWRIVALNLVGSIAFIVSAFAAFVRPATGELASVPISNLGTFVGAVCFFLGAALLIPELRDG